MKSVYTCFCTDVIHEGHLNIIEQAGRYGKVIVGILTDEAMIRFNHFPTVDFNSRWKMVEELAGVSKVVVQDEIMYDRIVEQYHPDYIIHGDNWKEGALRSLRDNAVLLLSEYGGQVIDVPYTYNENIKRIDKRIRERLAMPEYRRKRLRQLLHLCPVVKTLEVHSGLTGLIAEKTIVADDGAIDQFDAMWISSLCDSTAKGKPDIELVDMTSRFRTIEDLMEVTTKPIIFDGDTGGKTEHFVYTVRTLERLGVSMIIIEDKIGLKRNSLFGTEVSQQQDDIGHFCEKIRAGKKAQKTQDFMICARIESLILEQGMQDALERAFAFCEAGADAIMIHSRKKDPAEIFEFVEKFRAKEKYVYLVVVPTSFNAVREDEFKRRGVNIVIYANQLLRATVPAIQQAATMILENHRAQECDNMLMPFKEIIRLIPEETDV